MYSSILVNTISVSIDAKADLYQKLLTALNLPKKYLFLNIS